MATTPQTYLDRKRREYIRTLCAARSEAQKLGYLIPPSVADALHSLHTTHTGPQDTLRRVYHAAGDLSAQLDSPTRRHTATNPTITGKLTGIRSTIIRMHLI